MAGPPALVVFHTGSMGTQHSELNDDHNIGQLIDAQKGCAPTGDAGAARARRPRIATCTEERRHRKQAWSRPSRGTPTCPGPRNQLQVGYPENRQHAPGHVVMKSTSSRRPGAAPACPGPSDRMPVGSGDAKYLLSVEKRMSLSHLDDAAEETLADLTSFKLPSSTTGAIVSRRFTT